MKHNHHWKDFFLQTSKRNTEYMGSLHTRRSVIITYVAELGGLLAGWSGADRLKGNPSTIGGQSSSLSLRSSSRKAKANSTCLSGSALTSPPSPRQPTGRRSLRFLRGQRWVNSQHLTSEENENLVQISITSFLQVECCEITDPYMNTDRNKNCISIVIKRADFETKTPDYPGFDSEFHLVPKSNSTCAGSWIIEEDYAAQPAGGPLL